MRKFLISMALVSTGLTAAPALAQHHGGNDNRPGWQNRGPSRPAVNNLLRQLDQIDARINRSVQRRIISQREAISLRRESNQIRGRLGIRARNGLSGREFADLQRRVNNLEARVRVERRDRDRRPG